jgi:hypothetical protein
MDVSISVGLIHSLTYEFYGLIYLARTYIVDPHSPTVGRKSSINRSSRSTPRNIYYNRSSSLVDEIGNVREFSGPSYLNTNLSLDHHRIARCFHGVAGRRRKTQTERTSYKPT